MPTTPHIVFIPGLLCTGELYTAQIAALGTRIRYSIANHGGHNEIRNCAAAILDRAPEKFIPVGLSMGGYILLELLRQAPERIERFVIIDSSAAPDAPEQGDKRRAMIELAKTDGMDAVAEALVPSMLGRSNRQDEDLLGLMYDMARDTGPERFEFQQNMIMSRVDSRPDLPACEMPGLVIVGEEDVLTPIARAEEIKVPCLSRNSPQFFDLFRLTRIPCTPPRTLGMPCIR